jgi:hypothetical protein
LNIARFLPLHDEALDDLAAFCAFGAGGVDLDRPATVRPTLSAACSLVRASTGVRAEPGWRHAIKSLERSGEVTVTGEPDVLGEARQILAPGEQIQCMRQPQTHGDTDKAAALPPAGTPA